jgi:MFS superfamily sulfate permease-like transporter
MSSPLLAALPANYTTAAELTIAIPLSVLVIVLGWWLWAVWKRRWNRPLP